MSTLIERCIAQAHHQEAVQGYVRISAISKALGYSRQAVDKAFRKAVANGQLSEEQLNDWKQSYSLRTTRITAQLSRANDAWLTEHAKRLDLSWHDYLNRVLQKYIHTNYATSSQSPIP